VLPIVATPLVLSFLPGLTDTTDPVKALDARVEFCKTLVAPERLPSLPFADFSSWVGAATHIPPHVAALTLGRKQDAEPLKKAARDGLPLLIVHGKADLQISGTAVVEQMQPLFKDNEVALLDGVGHAPFYECAQSSFSCFVG
jgi:hypothetical protein